MDLLAVHIHDVFAMHSGWHSWWWTTWWWHKSYTIYGDIQFTFTRWWGMECTWHSWRCMLQPL